MKVVVAIDSLKGSLSSVEAGNAISEGIKKVYKDAYVEVLPLADGGEGTVEALTAGMGGELHEVTVTGPTGHPVSCQYGVLPASGTAIIEMAGAAGITLVKGAQRNPLHTTTYGVGEVILDAIRNGCRKFIIGIGGSATNDGGAGMLQALGYKLLDENEKPIAPGAKGLRDLSSIKSDHVVPELSACEFRIACDVTNPLCGPNGCSAVFGPQKGATPEMVCDMDRWLQHYAEIVQKVNASADQNAPGAGAAGGLGFALGSFTNAVLEPGIDIVLREIQLDERMQGADFAVTGEGRLDSQTVMGKAPIGVAKVAAGRGVPVLAFSGMVTEDAGVCNEHGIDAFFPILRRVVTLDEAMDVETSRKNLVDTVEQVFRLIRALGR